MLGAASPTDPMAAAPQQNQQIALQAMQEALANTSASTMANTAAAVAVAPPMGALEPPTLIDCILVDHSNTVCLFGRFFEAATVGDVVAMDMTVAALALELRLHSQAEMQVLYPILSNRLGDAGAQWATRAVAEHTLVEQSIADVMALRSAGGQALENRMKQLQTEFIAHQAEEEGSILPAVAAVIMPDEMATLVVQWKAAKQVAPLAPQAPSVMAAQAVAAMQTDGAGTAPISGTPTGVGAGPGTITTGDEMATGKAPQPADDAMLQSET